MKAVKKDGFLKTLIFFLNTSNETFEKGKLLSECLYLYLTTGGNKISKIEKKYFFFIRTPVTPSGR